MTKLSKCIFYALCLVIAVTLAVQAEEEKPSLDMKWYGYFKFDGSWDQNLTSHGNFVMWVNPRSLDDDDEQFNMTANETRFGLNLTGKGYGQVKVAGKIEFDLFAGVTGASIAENKAMLQLRHAYFSIQRNEWKLLAGQTWDLVSPLNPSTLNYPVLWGAGNIGYRRPQISGWYNTKAGPNTEITFAAGFFRTIGTDLTPTFSLATGESAEGSDDGTDAGIPSVQGLFDLQHKSASGNTLRAGVSGLWGRLKAETTLGNEEKYKTWAYAAHAQITWASGIGVAAEMFTGSNLGSYLGGILNNNTIDGTKATGGWTALWGQVSPKVKLSAGYGVDNPDDDDINVGNRSKNRCVFGNIRYTIVANTTVGFELSQWKTDYKGADDVKTLRGQTSFILNF